MGTVWSLSENKITGDLHFSVSRSRTVEGIRGSIEKMEVGVEQWKVQEIDVFELKRER